MKTILITICLLMSFAGISQSVLGRWKTIDDETGKERSIVEIYEEGGKLHGRIIQLFREPNEVQDPVCVACEDDRKDQRVLGMQIIRGLWLNDGYYQGGTICDPKNGKVYKCELWLDGADANKLQVRGYWGFFYRTQTWIRA